MLWCGRSCRRSLVEWIAFQYFELSKWNKITLRTSYFKPSVTYEASSASCDRNLPTTSLSSACSLPPFQVDLADICLVIQRQHRKLDRHLEAQRNRLAIRVKGSPVLLPMHIQNSLFPPFLPPIYTLPLLQIKKIPMPGQNLRLWVTPAVPIGKSRLEHGRLPGLQSDEQVVLGPA